MRQTDIYLGLGSNLGDRHTLLLQAIECLVQRVGPLVRCSSFIESELETTQQIERELGRTEKTASVSDGTPTYHDRPIDIDILLYGDTTVDEPDLQIPHPKMAERPFVMEPLREVQTPVGRVF